MSTVVRDATAPNWTGDLATLSEDMLEKRLASLSGYVCARQRPWADRDDAQPPVDTCAVDVYLDRWAACRDELMSRY